MPPFQGSELLRVASWFKRRSESRTFRSAVPLAAVFLFLLLLCWTLGLWSLLERRIALQETTKQTQKAELYPLAASYEFLLAQSGCGLVTSADYDGISGSRPLGRKNV